jgi:UDP-glucuronate 4-epimerase
MKVLLTGCAGFIASRVANRLVDDGHEVVGIDNMNHAYDVRLKEWRLQALTDAGKLTFTQMDLTDRERLGQFFSDQSPDAVINLAARAGVRQSVEDPSAYFETNVMGTLNLLELCRDRGVNKFIQASTSSAYGLADMPWSEDLQVSRPTSPYAASKVAAESLCYTYHHLFEIDVTVFRFFTVYGPAGRPDLSIFRFIKWIAEGEPVIVYGDGTQTRDFTHVDDVARGVVAALRPLGYEIINLGSDRPVSINDLISTIEKTLGASATIDNQPALAVDVPGTWADVRKAKRIFDWEPEITLEAGIREAVEWYLRERSWAVRVQLF